MGEKPSTRHSAVIARLLVEELLESVLEGFIAASTDRRVTSQRGRRKIACYILAFHINWLGRLNIEILSATAELCTVKVTIQIVLGKPLASKTVILTKSNHEL